MGKETGISWTDHTTLFRLRAIHHLMCPCSFATLADTIGLVMNLVVANVAERQAVGYIKTKIRKFRKMLDVMGYKIATFGIAAMLASKLVSQINIKPPSLVFQGISLTHPFGEFPILITVALFAAWGALAGDFANLCTSCDGMGLSYSIAWVTFSALAHPLSRFNRMRLSFERRLTTLCRFPDLYVTAIKTLGRQTIKASCVFAKRCMWFPLLATITKFQSCILLGTILFIRNAKFLSTGFYGSQFSLCHDCSPF